MGKALIIVDVQPTLRRRGTGCGRRQCRRRTHREVCRIASRRIRVHRHHTGLAYRTGNALVGQSRLRRHLAGAWQGRHRERRTASRDRRTEITHIQEGTVFAVILRFRRIGRQHRPHSHTNGGRRGSGGGQDACQCVAGGWRHARDVVGLAESHCVKETALDAKKLGYETHVIENLTEPVSEELGVEARRQMREAGVVLD